LLCEISKLLHLAVERRSRRATAHRPASPARWRWSAVSVAPSAPSWLRGTAALTHHQRPTRTSLLRPPTLHEAVMYQVSCPSRIPRYAIPVCDRLAGSTTPFRASYFHFSGRGSCFASKSCLMPACLPACLPGFPQKKTPHWTKTCTYWLCSTAL